MDDDLKRLLEAIREKSDKAHQETRRHFDVAIERIETRCNFLVETVQHVSEELQRTRVSLEGKIEQSAAETQAMIKFSHKELDRRVTSPGP